MKKLILYIISLLIIDFTYGQQIPMVSEFMLNDYIYNPAMGGKNGIPIINIGYRNQWAGFEGAPKTFYISGNGTIHNNKNENDLHDVGGYMFSDVVGPVTTRGVSAAYTYHKEIFKDHELSMGAFFGVVENSMDPDKITLPEDGIGTYDPAVYKDFRRRYAPDGAIGMLFYNEDYYVGFSIRQIFRRGFHYGNPEYDEQNRLNNHYYFMGSYEFLLNEHFSLSPNLLVKSVRGARNQYDLNAKLNYQDRAFVGLTIRSYDAMSFTLGFDVPNVGEFGYAYDLGVSKFRTAHSGSHEFIITFRFEDFKRKSKFNKSTPSLGD